MLSTKNDIDLQDTDFRTLCRSISSMGASILKSSAAFTAAQMQALVADLKSRDSTRAKAALASIGISESVLHEQKRLIGVLVTRYSLPQDPAELRPILQDAVTAAAKMSYSDGSGPAKDPLDDILDELDLPSSSGSGGNTDFCVKSCDVWAVTELASALTSCLVALALCPSSGPFTFLCVLAATGAYAWAIFASDKHLKDCLANCG